MEVKVVMDGRFVPEAVNFGNVANGCLEPFDDIKTMSLPEYVVVNY